MENKASFILYADLEFTVEKLPDEQAGKLFKHILKYVNDQNPKTDDLLVEIAFEPIKQQLKRDLTRWKGSREKRAEAGRKGGLARAAKAKASNATKSQANQAVNGNVNGSVSGNVNVNVNARKESKEWPLDWVLIDTFKEFIEHRKQMKKPMTTIAISRMVKKLAKYDPNTAEEMLAQSMVNGWAGVFEVKSDNNTKNGKKTRAEQAIANITSGGNKELDSLTGLGSF